MNNLKERLEKGEALHGSWLHLGSSISAEIVGNAGFDWVLIDLEHGAGGEVTLLPQLQAIGRAAATPLVRVESTATARVKRVLDQGVQGVMFPQIATAQEAEAAIANMYYPPLGKRGLAKMTRATEFGTNFENYYQFAQEGLLGIIQIETKECLQELDEIAAIKGVDVLFIGPADLSMALGVFQQWGHPIFVEAVEIIAAAARKAGKAAGVYLFDLDQYDFYYKLGFRFFGSGSDMAYISCGASTLAQQLNEQRAKSQ